MPISFIKQGKGQIQHKYVRLTSNILRTTSILTDVACFVLAFVLAKVLYEYLIGYFYNQKIAAAAAIVFAINFFLIRLSRDAYSTIRGQDDDLGSATLVDFLIAMVLTAFTIQQFGIMQEFSRGLGLLFILCSIVLLAVARIATYLITAKAMRDGLIGQKVVIYGADQHITGRVIRLLETERLSYVNVIGYADDRKQRDGMDERDAIGDVPYVGGFAELMAMAQGGRLDQIIVALPNVEQERLNQIIGQLSSSAIDICVMPREFLVLRDRYRVNYIGTLPVLNVWQQPIRDFGGLLKEIQDRVAALIAIILLAPLLLLTAILIKLDSPGPIFFRQRRFGFNNLPIEVLKFRSMHVDMQDVSGARRTQKGDPRVTRVGRVIRRFSIDELPQLFNVLTGNMSLVGPRPHATEMRVGESYYHDAVSGYAARHRVKPGITGLAQVRGLRGEIDTMERARKRVEYDMYYIEHWSPLFDLRIIFETVILVLWDKRAY
tara:strand:- start:96763 stop:98235 length:1473 start_codon:yes stop_codon:yes gene_type:complete